MSGITLEQAQAQLALWLEADAACARNQSYAMPDGRQLTRANAFQIRENIQFWQRHVDRLTRRGIGVRYGVPR